jgi:hypothetical protein
MRGAGACSGVGKGLQQPRRPAFRPVSRRVRQKGGRVLHPAADSDILSIIVTLDSQEPKTGPKKRLDSVLDFACGSGSLLLNVRKRMGPQGIGKIYGLEKNITTSFDCTDETACTRRPPTVQQSLRDHVQITVHLPANTFSHLPAESASPAAW